MELVSVRPDLDSEVVKERQELLSGHDAQPSVSLWDAVDMREWPDGINTTDEFVFQQSGDQFKRSPDSNHRFAQIAPHTGVQN